MPIRIQPHSPGQARGASFADGDASGQAAAGARLVLRPGQSWAR